MKRHLLTTVIACSACVFTAKAGAACVASDTQGTWHAHATFFATTDFDDPAWLRCKLVVNSSGGISPSASTCKLSDGMNQSVLAGTLRATSACGVTGWVSVGVNGVEHGRMAIQHGQLDRAKNNIAAVGRDSTAPVLKFQLHAVKQ